MEIIADYVQGSHTSWKITNSFSCKKFWLEQKLNKYYAWRRKPQL